MPNILFRQNRLENFKITVQTDITLFTMYWPQRIVLFDFLIIYQFKFVSFLLHYYNHYQLLYKKHMSWQNRKYQVISFDKVLNNYQNKKIMTKTIYPNQSSSNVYQKRAQVKLCKNKKYNISYDRFKSIQAEKYFGELPQAFKNIKSDNSKSLQSLSKIISKRQTYFQKDKKMQLVNGRVQKQNMMVGRRKLKQICESTASDSMFDQKNYKSLQFHQGELLLLSQSQSNQNNIFPKKTSVRRQNSKEIEHDYHHNRHNRVKTQKYQQLNLKSLIYDDKQLTISQKNCITSFAKKKNFNFQNRQKQKQTFRESCQKQGNYQKMFRFKLYKQKFKINKIQKQYEGLLNNFEKQIEKEGQGWIINQSNTSIF